MRYRVKEQTLEQKKLLEPLSLRKLTMVLGDMCRDPGAETKYIFLIMSYMSYLLIFTLEQKKLAFFMQILNPTTLLKYTFLIPHPVMLKYCLDQYTKLSYDGHVNTLSN